MTSPRPRLLFLCQTLPFPPDTGVAVRSYNILRILAESFDVTALCFYRRKAIPGPEELDASTRGLREFGRVEAFAIPQEHSRTRMLADHARSVLSGRVYTEFTYESGAYRARVRELVETGGFDVVHVDSLDLAAYLPLTAGVPTVCTHHNVESDLLRRRAEFEPSLARRAYLRHQGDLYERSERRWLPRVALNVAVSADDEAAFLARAPRARCMVVPNGVDTDFFQPRHGAADGIVFLGGTEWFPNRDALHYFSEAILPRLRSLGEASPVRWVGRSTPAERLHYSTRHGIELTGYLPDIRPHVADAACCVVPLRVGGGTRLKITTAWAMGKAVISTSLGCEGLAAVDGENLLIRDTPAEFAAAVQAVVRDPDLRRRLERNARATAEQLYGWPIVGRRMTEAYQALAGARGARSREAASGAR
jgi:glycosyltransferase involved in cell wall biosynthesis